MSDLEDDEMPTVLMPATEDRDAEPTPSSNRPRVLQTQVLRAFSRTEQEGPHSPGPPPKTSGPDDVTVVAPDSYHRELLGTRQAVDTIIVSDALRTDCLDTLALDGASSETCELTVSHDKVVDRTSAPRISTPRTSAPAPTRPPGRASLRSADNTRPALGLRRGLIWAGATAAVFVFAALTLGNQLLPRTQDPVASSPSTEPSTRQQPAPSRPSSEQEQGRPPPVSAAPSAAPQIASPEPSANMPLAGSGPAASQSPKTSHPPSPRQAADALFAGQRAEAQKAYQALASAHPDEVFRVLAELLAEPLPPRTEVKP